MDEYRNGPAWPPEARSAVFMKSGDYAPLMFRDQVASDVCSKLNWMRKNYQDVIQMFSESGGTIESGIDDLGKPDMHEWLIRIGTTECMLLMDAEGYPEHAIPAIDFRTERERRDVEITLIAKTALAVWFRQSPDLAKRIVENGTVDDRNARMVVGLSKLGDIARRDNYLLDHAVTGTNIDRTDRNG